MRFIVKLKLVGDLDFPEVEVEGEDRWEALVKYAIRFKLEKKFPMRDLWKMASIIKRDKKSTKEHRVERDYPEGMEIIE